MIRFPLFASLRGRLLLLLALVVLPWAAGMAWDFYEQWRAERARAVEALQAYARAAAREQRLFVDQTRTLLSALAALPEVVRGDGPACQARLAGLELAASGYGNIGVIGPDGRVLCDLAKGAGTYLGDRDYYQAAQSRRDFVAGHYILGRITARPVLPVAWPVVDQEGRVGRVVFAALDVLWLQRLLETTDLRPGAAASLLDREGIVLARVPADEGRVGRPHSDPALVEAIRRGGEGLLEATGEGRLIAHVPLRVGQEEVAHLAVSVPLAAIEKPLRARFIRQTLFLVLATLILFGFAWLISERLLIRQLTALRALVHRLAAGEWSARSGIEASGELGELARSLDALGAALKQSQLRFERVLDVAPEGILLTDAEGRIVIANGRCETLFGYAREELLGQPIELLLPEERRAPHREMRAAYMQKPRVREMGSPGLDLVARRKDGTVFPVDVSLGPLETEQGTWVVAMVRDMSERKRFEEEILRQATHDALTGLPNRTLFRQLLEQAMSQAQRDETLLAVIFLDLDGFKTLNDTLGHSAGDGLLTQVAARLRAALRASDVVARQGGDEFTILVSGVRHIQDVTRVAEKLLAVIAKPYEVEGREVEVTASLGITLYPIDDADADSLLRNADTAMYRAKHEGRNRYSFYTAEMNAEVRHRLEMETGLRRALREGQFEVFYQPQVRVKDGAWVGLEALIRWRHPERGLVLPGEFISIAEESGLIEPIGEWVLATVCRQIAEWKRRGLPPLRVAVNLSARQFGKASLLDDVAAILTGPGMGQCGSLLELEVTESILMGDSQRSAALLEGLRALGLGLAIDDFGTAYSSLSYLKRFPLTALKIDRSFIDGVVEDANDAAIARAIIELAHSLHLAVVAEGVETPAQWQWLKEHGCDLAQGYLFGRPMPAAEVEAQMRERCAPIEA